MSIRLRSLLSIGIALTEIGKDRHTIHKYCVHVLALKFSGKMSNGENCEVQKLQLPISSHGPLIALCFQEEEDCTS